MTAGGGGGGGRTVSIIINIGTGLKWSASRPNRFTPEKQPPVPTEEEAGQVPQPVRTLGKR